MNKITPDHLTRSAYVYVRQSTPDQLANNPESRRRQYALADRARVLGWENVIVIDDDLGRSGGGTARPGFERLLAAICTGAAGAVLAIEASRLARNGRDWHTLLEFCTLVNSLIIDEDGVYDPKLINDRLLLGMKGTFSELELSILRQRSQEALRLKAARGDLHTSVAIGYVRSADDRLEIDPDKRVREALHLAFRKFAEFASVRQVSMWLCDEGLKMPIVVYSPAGRMVEWQLPRYNTIHRLLTNPIYAGAYVYGRTGSKVRVEAGRKLITRSVRRPQQEWEVLIRDHHEAYISWEDYENNQRTINGNANMKGGLVPGSVRNGGGLLVGLLRCGHCAADFSRCPGVPTPNGESMWDSRTNRRGMPPVEVMSPAYRSAPPVHPCPPHRCPLWTAMRVPGAKISLFNSPLSSDALPRRLPAGRHGSTKSSTTATISWPDEMAIGSGSIRGGVTIGRASILGLSTRFCPFGSVPSLWMGKRSGRVRTASSTSTSCIPVLMTTRCFCTRSTSSLLLIRTWFHRILALHSRIEIFRGGLVFRFWWFCHGRCWR